MDALVSEVERLECGPAGKVVRKRMLEFKKAGEGRSNEIFRELCFCLLTANYNAEKAIKIQENVGGGFLSLPERALARKLRGEGYRFPNTRARYIVEARKHIPILEDVLKSDSRRDYLVKNVKGLGYKEASHFLRNIGFENYAIIDFHIVDLLVANGLIEKPKTMSKMRYLEIEALLSRLCVKLNLSQGELDLYLWYLETGKILK
ncbi:MAG: N-glycosylase/DNA lyase [Candidatus Altiarchaeota archaeon]|nr:N-glycosylase/DNA lyase [Candidatus Altiarchaeota archaeon]